jgi:hypothetical protein
LASKTKQYSADAHQDNVLTGVSYSEFGCYDSEFAYENTIHLSLTKLMF